MRLVFVLAPLLLTSCALLFPTTTTITSTHDGYELTCVDGTCLQDAEPLRGP